jgi:hypothetical protein
LLPVSIWRIIVTRMAKKKADDPKESPPQRTASVSVEKPFVFISHDSRDAEIAEAFANLLRDSSGGMLPSFRSSDKKGTAGIPFGEEWYAAVMTKLAQASDVVAVLTPHSVGRPWILYEAGVAKGSRNTKAYGVAIGIPLNKAIAGPFGQFQNLEATEDELTKLVLDLIHRNRDADPRQEAVRHCVQVFLEQIGKLVKPTAQADAESAAAEGEVSIAKMFEEVKVLVRDLPVRFDSQLDELRRPVRRMWRGMPPDFLMRELLHSEPERGTWSPLKLLVVLSLFREELPWLYDLGLEFYRAWQSRDEKLRRRAREAFQEGMRIVKKAPELFEHMGGRGEEAFHMLRHMFRDIDFLMQMERRRPNSKEEPEKPDGGKP